MKTLNEILDSIEVIDYIEADSRMKDTILVEHSSAGRFTIGRRLTIDSQTLLPTMDVHFKNEEGDYLGGFSGGFVTNEEIFKLNKLFVDAESKSYTSKHKRTDLTKDNFWTAINGK